MINDATSKTELLLTTMQALGVSFEELQAAASGTAPQCPTLHDYLDDKIYPTLTKGSMKVWRPYYALLDRGYPDLCRCACGRCLRSFRADSTWTPCHCIASGRCDCHPDDLGVVVGGEGTCLDTFTGYGSVTVAAFDLHDLQHTAQWAKLRAYKRTLVRTARRAAQGRPVKDTDGRSAMEHLRNATSYLYRNALAVRLPGVTVNVALQLRLPQRPDAEARAYEPHQLEELWNTVFTSGSDDPELDMLLVWYILETGSRRGGSLKLTIGDLLVDARRIRLYEKEGTGGELPISLRLLVALLGHALERGDVVAVTAPGLEPHDVTVEDVLGGRARLRADQPVFYYRRWRVRGRRERVVAADGTVTQPFVPELDADGNEIREPHPLTRKRFETLWARLKRDLPWLDEIHGGPHDLRRTAATYIERAWGYAIAKGFLRQKMKDPSGAYIKAKDAELARAMGWWTEAG
jgi:integrase